MGATFDRITAAAARIITRKGAKSGAGAANGWQVVAWDQFESTPEVGAYGKYIGNVMSGARLIAARRAADNSIEPVTTGRAAELVASIAGGPAGQSKMLGTAGTQLAVAGETWAIIIPNPAADSFADDRWVTLSNEEAKPQRGKIKVTVDGVDMDIPEPDPETGESNPDDPIAIRVWDPSPRKYMEATSPVRASLTVLEELRLLNAAVAAIARSRITGRGVLLVPAGTRFPAQPGQENAEDSLLDIFIEVASTSIREPESAAATVPIVLEVPGDLINGVKWLHFGSEFDTMMLQLRDEAVRRFAAGVDIPAEILLGLGDASHWGAWAITAEALKTGAEPRLGLFTSALTDQWLRPLLEAENDPDAAEVFVWFDTSGLRSSSNKGASALEAFKEGLISGAAARRELGFTEADGPTDGQLRQMKTPPAPANERDTLPVNETQTAPGTGPDAVTASSGVKEIRIEPGDGDRAWALTAAVDGILWAAVHAAGERIMRTPACPRPARTAARELSAHGMVHTTHPVPESGVRDWHLLDNAFVRVPEIAARYGVDDQSLAHALDSYATALLTTGQPHTYENTVRVLAQSGIIPATIIGMVTAP